MPDRSTRVFLCPPPEDLLAFTRGKMDEAEASDFVEHLNGCELCSQDVGVAMWVRTGKLRRRALGAAAVLVAVLAMSANVVWQVAPEGSVAAVSRPGAQQSASQRLVEASDGRLSALEAEMLLNHSAIFLMFEENMPAVSRDQGAPELAPGLRAMQLGDLSDAHEALSPFAGTDYAVGVALLAVTAYALDRAESGALLDRAIELTAQQEVATVLHGTAHWFAGRLDLDAGEHDAAAAHWQAVLEWTSGATELRLAESAVLSLAGRQR